jgi:ribosome-binding factor A
MSQFKRSDRLGEQIRRDISLLLETELADLNVGMVTFTRVRLTNDLRYARVYYSFLGDEAGKNRVAEYLQRESKRIRSAVGRQLHVHHIPELTFMFDPSVEEGIRIEQLLNEIKSGRKQD